MGWIFDKNLFVLPLGADGRWLRYHPLFREFLQARLKEERPGEVPPLLERMVKYYEHVGEWEKAYDTCKQLNDIHALADVVEYAGTAMLQNALVTLEGWVDSLPPALVGHLQVVVALVDDCLDPQAALDRPRFCITQGQVDGRVALEEGIPQAVVATLARMGHPVTAVSGYDRAVFGRGQVILRDPASGVLCAGSDPRADGFASTY